MSCSTGIPVSDELKTVFDAKSKRFLVVRIVNEELILDGSGNLTSSIANDWSNLPSTVGDQACYVLVRLNSPSDYLTITYVPSGTKIKDKMLYASTKSSLQRSLGFQFFAEELHANTASELEYSHWEGSQKPVYAYSKFEEERFSVHKQEDEERSFRVKNQNRLSGSGGYHAVTMAFDQTAKDLISQFKSGSGNLVELKINDSKDGINGVGISTATANNLSSKLTTNEPRFYLYKHTNQKTLSLYVCPPNSPPKLRMVYSTTKPSVQKQIKTLGVTIDKTKEISEAADCNAAYLTDCFKSSYVSSYSNNNNRRNVVSSYSSYGPPKNFNSQPEWARNVQEKKSLKNSSQRNSIAGAHPVYSLMSPNGGQKRTTKKIILPPRHAY
eukprot:TRINITY_DN1248_c1_g1_i1.p1 TRINITY_DN1248_c1_g1~~TRINITY_DN1248_c1_g1_i1.p1  ORF type:complete len:384 (+),score=122.74 TRINITY_DN1248_c1_g1_i1:38-1189(+)